MATIQDYIEGEEERESGHVDTREDNFECEGPTPTWAANLGIDVAG